jgi:hypothetical protein
MSNSEETLSTTPASETEQGQAKLEYQPPEFIDLGSVEQLTLGGTNTGFELFGAFASI